MLQPEVFVLFAAAQILLFAPQNWEPDRIYTRDTAQYLHRFPTPEFIGGGTDKTVSGLYSMEDLLRAILMFYSLIKRRTYFVPWLGTPPSDSNFAFVGYYDPNAEAGPPVVETRSESIDSQVNNNGDGNALDTGIAVSAEPNFDNSTISSSDEASIDSQVNNNWDGDALNTGIAVSAEPNFDDGTIGSSDEASIDSQVNNDEASIQTGNISSGTEESVPNITSSPTRALQNPLEQFHGQDDGKRPASESDGDEAKRHKTSAAEDKSWPESWAEFLDESSDMSWNDSWDGWFD
ncbi:hypothetical protein FPOA_06757 [Fusarium poae]|uniref:Uncharacterized protein n=1 Tax=Fusarium poae TaxID=36050 RepID=A0A1B8AJ99_FUSPO|nr:hypothetical protein FPOA_06757 [Fusarium poae]